MSPPRGNTAATPAKDDTRSAERLKEVIEELQVHRRELEMQNHALSEAQQDLQQSMERYADLFDSLPIGYVTLNPSGQITEANLAAAEMMGLQRASALGKFLRRYLLPEDRARFGQHLEGCLRSPETQRFESVLESSDGMRRPVQFSSRKTQANPSLPPQIRAAITDISEEKRVQQELRNTTEEQEAFTYSISHDLRAPLVTITNYAEYLATEYGNRFDAEAVDVLGRIRRAAQRMDEILQNLLLYSRIARAPSPLAVIDLENVVTETLLQHQGVIQDRNADVRMAAHLPAVRASRELLGQVLANLLTNALKYAKKDQPPRVEIAAREEGDTVVITIADEGIGIAPKDHERVFRIFERLHGQSEYPGTGIGLAVVQRAVERMNGRIWIESDLGRGSRFHVALARA